MRSSTNSRFTIRHAVPDEVPILDQLIRRSVHGLMGEHLTPAQMEVALGTVFGVDKQIVADGTYFVVEAEGRTAGVGGWSLRHQLYGVPTGEPRRLDPATEAARIRAFFVDPEWARQGIATLILEHAESEARAAGFRTIQLLATPTGFPFYRARGYETLSEDPVTLSDGSVIHGCYVMRKTL